MLLHILEYTGQHSPTTRITSFKISIVLRLQSYFLFCFVTSKEIEANGHKLLACDNTDCKGQSQESNPGGLSTEGRVSIHMRQSMGGIQHVPRHPACPSLSPGIGQFLAPPLTRRVTLNCSPLRVLLLCEWRMVKPHMPVKPNAEFLQPGTDQSE